ncbi:18093_t:CDS:2, partial [Cetraspora pellucida]
MNQPINQAVGHQPLAPPNVNNPVNSSFENLTAEERYKLLYNGTDSFKPAHKPGNQDIVSIDSAKASDFESKDASQVPLEHRKQASMESAFSVYDFPGEQVQLNYQSHCPN